MKQDQLEEEILHHEGLYREGNPEISDTDFDSLLKDLKENFPDSDLLKRGVIAPEPQTRKRKLPFPMFSLEKVKTIEELLKFFSSCPEYTEFVVTPKFDGISVCTTKTEGFTRGDGEFGQDITDHLGLMNIVSGHDPEISFGEAIMKKSVFNKKYADKYANPRNMVAGLLNRDTPTEVLADVDFIPYGSNENCNKLETIQKFNCPYVLMTSLDFSVGFFDALYAHFGIEYQIDGLVFDVNDHQLREELGRLENGNPRFAAAYKNPEWAKGATSKVRGVKIEVSKQGKLKPVISIEPVQVGGVTIDNVTGYNLKYVFDHNIAEGSVVEIVRSGDVIPKHIKTVSFTQNEVEKLADTLMECPSCGEPTSWDSTMTEIVCRNFKGCRGIHIARNLHFFTTIGFEEIGQPTIEKLYDAGLTDWGEIIQATKDEIVAINGIGESFYNSLQSQYSKIKKNGVSEAKWLHAVDASEGVFGEKTFQLIFDSIDLEHFRFCSLKEKRDLLLEINGVGEVTADIFIKVDSIFGYDRDPSVINSFALFPISYIKTPKVEQIGVRFANEKLCFTGCRPTKELELSIKQQGGEVVSGVSKNTTILVVKDLSDATLSSSKAKKAKELGIKILKLSDLC